jgi:Ca2+-transporting ATPase
MKPYQKKAEEVAALYDTDLVCGLSEWQAQEQLKRSGPNRLPELPVESLVVVFTRQFKNPLIYVLLVAATLIFFSGSKLDACIIGGVLCFNALVGTIQEGRTRSLLVSLRHLITVNAVVVRGGKQLIIPNNQVVVGDLIVLGEGDIVPADARLVEAAHLMLNEAMLTGESGGVVKNSDLLFHEMPLYEQINMVFKGTMVLCGQARAIVVATGATTQVAHLQLHAATIRTDMPIKKELDYLSHTLLIFIMGLCGFLLMLGLWWGKPFKELLVMLTALFICVVPEGLPIVLTLVLVTGAYRMGRNKVLVKKLQAVDALGRAQVIIIDKTGTLTRNEMMVSRIFTNHTYYHVTGMGYDQRGIITQQGNPVVPQPGHPLYALGLAGALLNRATISYHEHDKTCLVQGNPTQAALGIVAQKIAVYQALNNYRLLKELPFDRVYGYHAAFYAYEDEVIAWVSGSPEVLMKCSSALDVAVNEALTMFLDQGLRVVALAMKKYDPLVIAQQTTSESFYALLEHDLIFLGLCGIQDTLRPEAATMVTQLQQAGMRVIMATGDHIQTALFVARQVGIFQEEDEYLEGKELAELSQEEWLRRIAKITVYARVSPEHKMRLIKQFHALNKVVVMAGDGVNDAPALVAADVGITMGIMGTEVAKEAADVVLLDDSFNHMIQAVEQGRHIIYTLRRVILYFFATNLGEILVVLFALLLNWPLPILAAQILWLNLVTDGFLDMALALEPQEEGLRTKKWLARGARLIDGPMIVKIILMALVMGTGSLIIFHWYRADIAKARTMTLVVMALYQWFNAWNCRSQTKPLGAIGLFSNRWFIVATVVVGILQLLLVTVPWMQFIFHTVTISWADAGLALVISCPLLLVEEVRKIVMYWRQKKLEARAN